MSALHTIFDDGANRVLVGDSRAVLPLIGKQADLVFADPPFNIGHPYAGFLDRITEGEYRAFTIDWLRAAANILRPGGILCVHGSDEVCEVALSSVPDELNRIGWIVWHYRFGQSGRVATSKKCITSKAHLLVYAKPGGEPTWNPPLVLSDRATKYKDKRTAGTGTPNMRVALDVWGVPSDGRYWGRVQGTSKERWDLDHGALVDHPNQLPELYVARAISAFSNVGDHVVCPFGGSGTETVVSMALGRPITTIELSELSAASIVGRIKRGSIRITGVQR